MVSGSCRPKVCMSRCCDRGACICCKHVSPQPLISCAGFCDTCRCCSCCNAQQWTTVCNGIVSVVQSMTQASASLQTEHYIAESRKLRMIAHAPASAHWQDTQWRSRADLMGTEVDLDEIGPVCRNGLEEDTSTSEITPATFPTSQPLSALHSASLGYSNAAGDPVPRWHAQMQSAPKR